MARRVGGGVRPGCRRAPPFPAPPVLPPPGREANKGAARVKPSTAASLLSVAFLVGLGLTLTPCVYPLIPVTITVVGATATGRRLDALLRSCVYVLGISVTYSAVGLADYVNLGLVGVTLLINAIALSAILFRLASYGFTPNRVTVLGANLVIFIHLVWIGRTYLKLAAGKVEFDVMERVIGRYIPVYAAWAAFVTFGLPLFFQYQ